MSHVLQKIKEEFLAMLPPALFFFVALHIVALVRALMVKATGISPLTTVSVTIAALVLGKAVLIADMLPWINRYPEKPLIYNVAWIELDLHASLRGDSLSRTPRPLRARRWHRRWQ